MAAESLPAEVEVTHLNLNDRCVEGMRHKALPIFSVQYHPEAAPGPHDAEHHFTRFIELMQANQLLVDLPSQSEKLITQRTCSPDSLNLYQRRNGD